MEVEAHTRWTENAEPLVAETIMAVVDSFDVEGRIVFQKAGKGDR